MTTSPRHIPEIPPDSADGHSSFVHNALIITGRLGVISPWIFLPVWAGLVALSRWPWSALEMPALLISAGFLILDWSVLGLLPLKHRSWGPVTPSLLALTLVRTVLSWLGAWVAPTGTGLAILACIQGLISAVVIYATWIEPFRMDVTRQTYRSLHWGDSAPLNLFHISDLHFERTSPREHTLLATVVDLKPDLILLTGDYLNLSSVYDPVAQAGVRDLLSQFYAPLGVFAVTGSPVVDIEGIVPEIFDGLGVTWLDDEVVCVNYDGHELFLLGVRTTYDISRDAAVLTALMRDIPESALSILLYHTPDLFPTASELGVSLYLCGHTHGGQIRLPFYGALATSSQWGKRYEMGLYREGESTLYVSRGLGMEGLGAPRARFLAPPEVVMWMLVSGD